MVKFPFSYFLIICFVCLLYLPNVSYFSCAGMYIRCVRYPNQCKEYQYRIWICGDWIGACNYYQMINIMHSARHIIQFWQEVFHSFRIVFRIFFLYRFLWILFIKYQQKNIVFFLLIYLFIFIFKCKTKRKKKNIQNNNRRFSLFFSLSFFPQET